jgi:hypothetical protein
MKHHQFSFNRIFTIKASLHTNLGAFTVTFTPGTGPVSETVPVIVLLVQKQIGQSH